MSATTMRQARAAIRALGLRVRATGWDDYRVFWPEDLNFADRGYYTTDLDDAIDTAKAMAAERARRNHEAPRSMSDRRPGPI